MGHRSGLGPPIATSRSHAAGVNQAGELARFQGGQTDRAATTEVVPAGPKKWYPFRPKPTTKGGRHRWHIENQGFNRQKNSGFNLEHVFSIDLENLKAYYYLLQIAHMIQQLVEAGSLLRNLAAEFGRTPMQLFGSLKNLARRMLDAFRYMVLNDQAFDPCTPPAFKSASIVLSP